MYRPVALFIGLRYMLGRSADRFRRFVFYLFTIGITIAVMALVTVLSVMNGFERELQNNILDIIPHAIISSPTGSINPQQLPESNIKLQGAKLVTPLTTGNVVLQSACGVSMSVMLGIDPMQLLDLFSKYLIKIKQTDLESGKYNVVLGEKLAELLSVKNGDQLRVMVPSASHFTPIGRIPSQRLFNVIGTFATKSEVDEYQMLVNIQDASRLMRYPKGNITGWRLWMNEPLKVDKLIHQKLPEGTTIWQDWRDCKGELFQAVRMEKNMMALLLSLIVIVAAFNVISSLGLIVIEKQSEIAILQTQGITHRQIMAVFMIQGGISSIIGTLLGAVLGVVLANQLNNLLLIIGILFNYVQLPVAIEPLQIIGVSLATITIALLSTLYSSWRAASTQPADVLRYE